MTRRALDSYYTPAWQPRVLLAHQEISGTVLESCAGDGGVAKVIDGHGRDVILNDLSYHDAPVFDGHTAFALGAEDRMLYRMCGPVDWVVTNPPYQMPLCRDIVAQAVKHARVGVAMLLRLSFLEPTAKVNPRGPWLERHPPTRILILPRYSYTQDGKSDSCTTAWMIWLIGAAVRRRYSQEQTILCLHNADVMYTDLAPALQEELT